MARFIVKSPLKYAGKRYVPGETVEIWDDKVDVIEPLVAGGVIAAIEKTTKASTEDTGKKTN
jgi:hypothetical protein